MTTNEGHDWKPGDPIGYINLDIPEFELPRYEGERYEALVPDTLDLQERARLALHALTEVTDPLADYEPYWIVAFRSDPPFMMHNSWQGPGAPKFMWAASLMRLVSGVEQNLHVERRWMETALQCQGADGLIYIPTRGRPWAYVWYPEHALAQGQQIAEALGGQELTPFGSATMLSAMAHFAKRDDNPVWRKALRRIVEGLSALAVEAGDVAFFWPSIFVATRDRSVKAEMPTNPFECEATVVPHGLVHAYRLLGYEPALTLARKFIGYLRQTFYGPGGEFLASPGDPWNAHFHCHARGLLAMEEYAEAADDQELMEFVARGYEWAREVAATHRIMYGAPDAAAARSDPSGALMGFFPEWTHSDGGQKGETCCVTDMIALALRLSEAGVADYWDDADRWTRNHLAEAQLTHTEWTYRLPRDLPVEPYSTTERVPERNLGAFAGGPDPNDWYAGLHTHVIGHCCTANGAKVLYWIWERILRYQGGKLRVNLLLNRSSAWADVDSFVPYQGRVDVKVKMPLDLSIRIPEWVSPQETRCQVNGEDRALDWDGRYARVGSVTPGEVATLRFPIPERLDRVQIEKRDYTLLRKGNEVVSIDPMGRYCPTYQRQHYLEESPRWRRVTRFVSNEELQS